MLLKIAQVMEDNLEYLATLDCSSQSANLAQLISLIVSITSVISRVLSVQMKEASLNMIKYIKHRFTRAYWGCWRNHSLNFPMLMLAWKVVSELRQVVPQLLNQLSKHQQEYYVNGIDRDILPAGVLNIVTGFGAEAGQV
jgi:aldehyde dehydrogenase (NAD+)/aldehyde dehydrogenase